MNHTSLTCIAKALIPIEIGPFLASHAAISINIDQYQNVVCDLLQ